MSERTIETVGRTVVTCVRLAWWVTVVVARWAARPTVRLLPTAGSRQGAVGVALLGWCLWTGTGALLFLSGDPALGTAGLAWGALVGALIARALYDQGLARARAARGAVQFGALAGTLNLAQPFTAPREQRLRHLWVTGPTGAGKSTLIKNLVRQDLRAPGRPGVMVVDVKDDLVLDIAARVPAERLEDVLLFDPAD